MIFHGPAQPVGGHGHRGTARHGHLGTESRASRNGGIGHRGTPPIRIALIARAFSSVARAVTRARVF
jgi:hypothetical protein